MKILNVNAEWVDYMSAYRVYDPKQPQITIAYEKDLKVLEKRVLEEGYNLCRIERRAK